SVRTTVISGTIKSGTDIPPGRIIIETQSPDRMRIDLDASGIQTSRCYNGKSAWSKQADGLRTLLGSEADSLRLYALILGSRLRGLSAYRVQIAHGSAPPGDAANLTPIDLSLGTAHATLFFDPSTHLLVKARRESADSTETVYYGDYRKVDGILEPFSIRIEGGPTEMDISVDRIEHNKSLDPAVFRYPQSEGEAPLPDVGAMLKTLVTNQEKIEEMREHYTFRELQTELVYDGGGHLKETKEREYEVTPVGDTLVHREIKENGKDLSSADRDKEDKRVQKEVEDIIKRREKREKQAEKKGKDEDDEEEVTVLTFLKATEITSERRETLGGQQVIAFDFEPKKDFKPKSRTESLVSKLAGTIWVDQDANQIARLEAHFTGSFKVGGGLVASVSPSTAFIFEQKKIDDEVWLPSYAQANISAKILLLAKYNRGLTMRFSDYKKYHIDSSYDVKKPPSEDKSPTSN
ncbi:MAG TPA: hypothetical protein VI756_13695, partial [Blastocatellia bacterium]